MNKFSVALTFVLFALTVGCTVTSQRAAEVPQSDDCETIDDDKARADCFKEVYAAQKQINLTLLDGQPAPTASQSAPVTPPQPTPAAAPPALMPPTAAPAPQPAAFLPGAPPVAVRADFVPDGSGGCIRGNNVSTRNETSQFFLVVRGNNLRPCGDGGLVPRWISQGNGSITNAFGIMPGAKGLLYFYPWKSVGGQPVADNGYKEVEVEVYAAVSGQGFNPSMPASYVTVKKFSMTTPFAGTWQRITVTDNNVRNWR